MKVQHNSYVHLDQFEIKCDEYSGCFQQNNWLNLHGLPLPKAEVLNSVYKKFM